jgi:hypothetical protein
MTKEGSEIGMDRPGQDRERTEKGQRQDRERTEKGQRKNRERKGPRKVRTEKGKDRARQGKDRTKKGQDRERKERTGPECKGGKEGN